MITKKIPEGIPESDREAFSGLSPESQKVPLVHYQESIVNVMNGPKIGQNQVAESTGETLNFGLTIEEKQSIEDDINAGKPIMATPSYTKFLAALLPSGLRVEDENGVLIFSRDTPEYEIHNGAIRNQVQALRQFSRDTPEYEIHNGAICTNLIGNIRTNHVGAVFIVVKGLSELFGRAVRLPTSTEVQNKIQEHIHYAGCRAMGSSVSYYVGDVGYGWVDGDADSEGAPYVFRKRNGEASSPRRTYHYGGLSLFPCFG